MTAQNTAPRRSGKVGLIDYLSRQGRPSSMDWEEYLITQVDDNENRDKKEERTCIRISYSPRIDVNERRQINAVLSDHGYDQRTRDITIGKVYRQAKQAASRPKPRICLL